MGRLHIVRNLNALSLPEGEFHKHQITVQEVKEIIAGTDEHMVICLSKSDNDLLVALRELFDVPLNLPETNPGLHARLGDRILIMDATCVYPIGASTSITFTLINCGPMSQQPAVSNLEKWKVARDLLNDLMGVDPMTGTKPVSALDETLTGMNELFEFLEHMEKGKDILIMNAFIRLENVINDIETKGKTSNETQ